MVNGTHPLDSIKRAAYQPTLRATALDGIDKAPVRQLQGVGEVLLALAVVGARGGADAEGLLLLDHVVVARALHPPQLQRHTKDPGMARRISAHASREEGEALDGGRWGGLSSYPDLSSHKHFDPVLHVSPIPTIYKK